MKHLIRLIQHPNRTKIKFRCQVLVLFFVSFFWSCLYSEAAPPDITSFQPPGIAYQPRDFISSREQIVADLRLLRKNGFRSLVTYGSSGALGSIPEIARQEGFDGMIIMGIWDISSEEEWANALLQASFVDGYCLGNEGLGIRYSPEELSAKMNELRHMTGLPVTTTEPITSYLEGPYRVWLLKHSDWLFPLAQPFWYAKSDLGQAVNWIMAHHDLLVTLAGRRVILKEAGLPTLSTKEANEETQLAFFKELESTGILFFYFEAIDQTWKRGKHRGAEVEPHWGLYSANGKPKKIIPWLTNRWGKR